ncbi:MAG: hypothetical protein JW779_14620 [Candidatus Thorarchaeota archaeon]|nr:hypothetical protein [Candidatus Thorarchaeota archaeon]
MMSEIIDIELDNKLKTEFFEIIRYLEKAPPSIFRKTLEEISTYSKNIRNSLVAGNEIPKKFIIFNIGFGRAQPIYQKLLEFYGGEPDVDNVFKNLNNAGKLFIINKLWKPGLFTTQDLADFLNTKQKNVSSTIDHMNEYKIIGRKTLGIYGTGEYGNLAMNLFAYSVIMWRRHFDDLYKASAYLLASKISDVLDPSDTLSDAIRLVENRSVKQPEPIVVAGSDDNIYFLNQALLNIFFCLALDSFLDHDSISLDPLQDRLRPIMKRGFVIDSNTNIAEAYRAALEHGGMVFLRRAGELYYLRPECILQ